MSMTLDMAAIHKYALRFDAMSLRERILLSVAALFVLLMLWNLLLMQPLDAKQKALQGELDEISTNITNTATAMETAMAPSNTALAQIKQATADLAEVDHQLSTTIAGMIAPEHMAEVIQDVLQQQHSLTLVELHNEPVTPLVDTSASAQAASSSSSSSSAPDGATDTTDAAETTSPIPDVKTGPYVHPLAVVVDGSYVDIVSYLKALETMKWHVYWNRLELETRHYPLNRVRIEISTLSLDETWLGL